MALSDYLTGKEWDACFYRYAETGMGNFGDSMHQTIRDLLSRGYRFHGLDQNGDKECQVENGVNASKVCWFVGNPYKIDILEILVNGREFLKKIAPDLITTSDADWEEQIKEARQLEAKI